MLRRFTTVLTATAALSALGGSALACPSPDGDGPTGPDGKAGGAAKSTLTIVYQEDEDATEERFVLRCDAATGRAIGSGSHPDGNEACQAVSRATQGVKNPWEPVSKDAMCTQIYGGPQTARVTGSWAGRAIDARFDRTNGCEISRWDTLTPALPDVAAETR